MKATNYIKKDIQVLDFADVVVIGGGVAGSVAAISTLKEGKSCILIEKSNALGGSATNGLVIPFMNSYVANPCGLNVSYKWSTYDFIFCKPCYLVYVLRL